VSFTLNPGTADEVTIMVHVVIADHELPDTLIGMSVIGPLGLDPSFRREAGQVLCGQQYSTCSQGISAMQISH
jgi:hypothetical protein